MKKVDKERYNEELDEYEAEEWNFARTKKKKNMDLKYIKA